MFGDKISAARKQRGMTQEALAERIGVSRQALAKWESGESIPDIDRAAAAAKILGLSLEELVEGNEPEAAPQGPPKGKYLFGIADVNDKGQIVIPREARRIFNIKPGDRLVVLGDDAQGIALVKAEGFLMLAEALRKLQ